MFYLNDQTLIINETDFAEKLESLTNLEMRNVFEGLMLKLKEDYKKQAEIKCDDLRQHLLEDFQFLLYDVFTLLDDNLKECNKLMYVILNTKRINRQQIYIEMKNIKEKIYNAKELINNNM